MSPTEFDFSDILFVNDEWPREPLPIDGLNETDSAIVRWLRRLVASRDNGTLQVEYVAWFAARLLCNGGVLVWLAQEQKLLDSGLSDIFGECAELVPEPWAGFLRWAAEQRNLEAFRSWPPYTSEAPIGASLGQRQGRQRTTRSRRR